MRRRPPLCAIALLVVLGAAEARADPPSWLTLPRTDPGDPYELPDAPAAPTLPDLTHRAVAVGVETTIGSVKGNVESSGATPHRTAAVLARLQAEWAVAIRRWYLGAAQEVAVGAPAGSGTPAFLVSHPEVWGRAVWASRAGLAFGGGLGVIPPVANRDESSRAADVERQVRVVRPWDWPYFAADTLTLRPFVDVRAIDGAVTLQIREGIDWSTPVTGGAPTLTSRTTLYAGYRVAEPVGLGIEAWEVYAISSDQLRDDQRAFYAVSPFVRLMTRTLQPAVSALVPIDRPLFGVVDSFWAVRLDLTLVLEPEAAR